MASAAKLAASLGLGGDYPNSWDEFVGQTQAKKNLRIACASARQRSEPLDPVLITGGTGLGKTTLAFMSASELGSGMKMLSSKVKWGEARLAITDMSDGDVLFIDEVHQLFAGSRYNGEWLLHLLENGRIVGPLGPEDAPKISVVMATTDGGRLPATLMSRVDKDIQLVGYTSEEAAKIALGQGRRILGGAGLPVLDRPTAVEVARAGAYNPRQMRNVLLNLRDVAVADNLSNYNRRTKKYDLVEALELSGLTPDGLTISARRYLVALLKDFSGGAGERPLKERLQEPGGLGHIERTLSAMKLIVFTKQGRVLSAAGIKRARELAAEGVV